MAREKSIQIGVINITTHPHSANNYKEMFKMVFTKKITSKIRGDEWGMIGSLRVEAEEVEEILFGNFYKFLNIDSKGKWLDMSDLKPIDPSENGDLIPVPEHIKPNLKEISYVFHPGRHRLFFESNQIAANSVIKLLTGLFSEKDIKKKYGRVDLTAEATHEVIKKIISIPRITKLNIKFNRPNDDDFGAVEERVLGRFKKQNIMNFNQISTTRDEEGIKPDDETKALMNIAKSNGMVRAEGYDQGKKIIHSTQEHPIIRTTKYNPDLELKMDAMIVSSLKMLKKL